MTGTIGDRESPEKTGGGAAATNRREIPYLGVIKIATVVMGVMIIVGVAVLAVTIVKRLSGASDSPPAADTAARQSMSAPPMFEPPAIGDLEIDVPPGSSVTDVALDGRHLALTLRLSGGETAVLLIDAATGSRLGLLTLRPTE